MDHGGDDDVPVLPGHLGDQAEVQEASDGRLWQAGRAGRRGKRGAEQVWGRKRR